MRNLALTADCPESRIPRFKNRASLSNTVIVVTSCTHPCVPAFRHFMTGRVLWPGYSSSGPPPPVSQRLCLEFSKDLFFSPLFRILLPLSCQLLFPFLVFYRFHFLCFCRLSLIFPFRSVFRVFPFLLFVYLLFMRLLLPCFSSSLALLLSFLILTVSSPLSPRRFRVWGLTKL